jgi:hypothetical protein
MLVSHFGVNVIPTDVPTKSMDVSAQIADVLGREKIEKPYKNSGLMHVDG